MKKIVFLMLLSAVLFTITACSSTEVPQPTPKEQSPEITVQPPDSKPLATQPQTPEETQTKLPETTQPKEEAPITQLPKEKPPNPEPPKVKPPKADPPKVELPKVEVPQPETPVPEPPNIVPIPPNEDLSQVEKPSQPEIPTVTPPKPADDMVHIQIMIGDKTFLAKLVKSKTTEALIKEMPFTVTLDELNGNEKYYYLSKNLPTASYKPVQIKAGDLMLYGSDCLVLFYESFSTSYSYTKLGSIEDVSGLSDALGSGSVQVTFKAE